MAELRDQDKAILHAALSIDDALKRTDYLDAACHGNPELRRQIDSLLAADEGATSFMSRPAGEPIADHDDEWLQERSRVIGRYKLLQKIGEGGFGLVFMAEQQEPVIRRVALKIIKLGFTRVCGAIQHAHQKGVIHRDIKPTNILISLNGGKPIPKVIDFGIAKATQQRLTDKTLFTRFDQFIGTPIYMSPEQVEMGGLDIDTRSDVYSLGVLLYELLTGRPPFDPEELRKAGYDEIRQRIRDEEPCTPSSRVLMLERDDLTTVATIEAAIRLGSSLHFAVTSTGSS